MKVLIALVASPAAAQAAPAPGWYVMTGVRANDGLKLRAALAAARLGETIEKAGALR